jgi:hypothetical protein
MVVTTVAFVMSMVPSAFFGVPGAMTLSAMSGR